MGAGAVAAVARREQRRIIDHLRLARAIDSSSAVGEPALPSFIARRQLTRLEGAGVVRRVADGRVYLDEHAYIDWRDARRRRAKVLLAVSLVLVLALAVGMLATGPATGTRAPQ